MKMQTKLTDGEILDFEVDDEEYELLDGALSDPEIKWIDIKTHLINKSQIVWIK